MLAKLLHASFIMSSGFAFAAYTPGTASSFDYTQLVGNNPLDRIPDFSFAGYGAGTKTFFSTARSVVATLSPNGAVDRTADIQAALDSAKSGGVVLLAAGDYYLTSANSIVLRNNGVLLSGVSSATRLLVDGPSRSVFTIGDPVTAVKTHSILAQAPIADTYVPVGATSCKLGNGFTANNAWTVGNLIYIEKTISASFVTKMGMDNLVRSNAAQTWINTGDKFRQIVTITKVDAATSTISWDVPLTESLDSAYGADGRIMVIKDNGQTKDVGIHNLAMSCVTSRSGESASPAAPLRAINIVQDVVDAHIGSLQLTGFSSEAIQTQYFSRQITIRDVVFTRTAPSDISAGLPFDITLRSSQTLVYRTRTEGPVGSDCWPVTTESKTPGPNVIAEYSSGQSQARHILSPHQRWSTGTLFDNCQSYQLLLGNRGIMGTGQGWTAGNSIAFSCTTTDTTTIQKPPLSQNWAIGCSAKGLAVNATAGVIQAGNKGLGSMWKEMLYRRVGQDVGDAVINGVAPTFSVPTTVNNKAAAVVNVAKAPAATTSAAKKITRRHVPQRMLWPRQELSPFGAFSEMEDALKEESQRTY